MLYVLSAVNIGLLASLIARAAYKRHLSAYLLFYSYIGYSLLAVVVQLVLVGFYGVASSEYRAVYNYTSFFIPVFQLTILANIYKRISGLKSNTRLVMGSVLVVIICLPILWTLIDMVGAVFYRIRLACFILQLAACFALFRVLINNDGLDIGRNLRGMLFGIGLLSLIQSYNFVALFTEVIRYDLFKALVPSSYILVLLIFNYSLWTYHPLREATERLIRVRLTERLRKATKSAIFLIFR